MEDRITHTHTHTHRQTYAHAYETVLISWAHLHKAWLYFTCPLSGRQAHDVTAEDEPRASGDESAERGGCKRHWLNVSRSAREKRKMRRGGATGGATGVVSGVATGVGATRGPVGAARDGDGDGDDDGDSDRGVSSGIRNPEEKRGGGGGGILGRLMRPDSGKRPPGVVPVGVPSPAADDDDDDPDECRIPAVIRNRLWRLPRDRDFCVNFVVSWKRAGLAMGNATRSLRLRRRVQLRSNSGRAAATPTTTKNSKEKKFDLCKKIITSNHIKNQRRRRIKRRRNKNNCNNDCMTDHFSNCAPSAPFLLDWWHDPVSTLNVFHINWC